MIKPTKATSFISYIFTFILIVMTFSFITMNSYHNYLDVQKQQEENVYSNLLQQVHNVDNHMAEIFDRSRLQKYWIEEIPNTDINAIHLDDYSWEYNNNLNVTFLKQTNDEYGSIFIYGQLYNLTKEKEKELKRILASFKIQKFMLDHVFFNTWNIYYTDNNIIATYPFVKIEEIFDPSEMAVDDLYDYVKQNIIMLKEEITEEERADGWESYLNYDVNNSGITFTRNWPVIINEKIYGIYQSGFDLEPLENIISMPYDNNNIFIVDGGNQIVYENGKYALEIKEFDLFDLNKTEHFEENPYGEGLYHNQDNKLTYILPFKNTKWKLIYELKYPTLSDQIQKVLYQYILSILLMLIVGIILLRYVRQEHTRILKKDKELLHKLKYDHLTGTLNKNMLLPKFNEFIENNNPSCFSVAMIDIDDFKKINDTYGHGFGDKVLVQVATTIKKSLRANDVVCRFGGEEFVLLLADTNSTLSIDICNRILKNVKKNVYEQLNVNVTVSIGVTMHLDSSSADSTLDLADANMYKAKRQGKNQLVYDDTVSKVNKF